MAKQQSLQTWSEREMKPLGWPVGTALAIRRDEWERQKKTQCPYRQEKSTEGNNAHSVTGSVIKLSQRGPLAGKLPLWASASFFICSPALQLRPPDSLKFTQVNTSYFWETSGKRSFTTQSVTPPLRAIPRVSDLEAGEAFSPCTAAPWTRFEGHGSTTTDIFF